MSEYSQQFLGATEDEVRELLRLAEDGTAEHNWEWIVNWAKGLPYDRTLFDPRTGGVETATPDVVLAYFSDWEERHHA